MSPTGHAATLDVVVIGAGFSGLYMLKRLRDLDLSVRVFEAGEDVGGTWYWNRYPGARCDVESMYYAYSFDDQLVQEWEWTEKYAGQPEILRYIQHVAQRHDLRRSITFNTRVDAAHFNERSSLWEVSTAHGERINAHFVVFAGGCLSAAKLPEVPGLDDFRGRTFHTAHWPHEGVDFSGQRVGVVGTGSSGIQLIPMVAEQADRLTVFQRTANFAFAAFNGPLDPDTAREIKADYPAVRQIVRSSHGGLPATPAEHSALEVSAAEREQWYTQRWQLGTLSGMLAAYKDILLDRSANDTAAEFVRGQIRAVVEDPQVAETLAPSGYPMGTKRPCLGTDYYETYNRDNVELVDLRQTPLVRITERGLLTSTREHELDAIVFATGFDAMTGPLFAIDITGRGGKTLQDKWSGGPVNYLGLATAGFPNLFTVTGPGSPSVISNMVVSIEQHVEWISDLIEHMQEHELRLAEATETAEQEWSEHVQTVASFTLYPQADSWYMGANVPGKPRLFMAYLGGVGVYRDKCDSVAAQGYEGFVLSG